MTQTKSFVIGTLASLLMIGGALSLTLPVQAQFSPGDPTGALEETVDDTSLTGGDEDSQIFNIIGRIINIVLGLLGIVFFIYVVWAGFIWMTASGDTTKVKKATDMLTQGTIGLVIILAAYAISNFAVAQLLTATQAA
ncbi:hypothetical protein A3B32_02225 [Candidatus Uhrbacteria bacterium RIFCSPLOWO2_01_FULL_53_9]|uniref:Uncharacterized protein n=3 Tax=Candidatus Uhriibacteriota TaxID=1752732 RepID=A0A1F7UXX3_9BACT|nr:MAG: hypothetical protein A3C17_03995 [Candidatus Uhrbacteria bacterium RIFCSPHIGHO2_02_FULL_53_13]OGL83123.1 MAG: hypothetical protein A3B32_02225 [Candidatus Uhrbacteria bacterium RIFCSPLOWO2_01_FULL_53_9]OGL89569.1 MAG: hypothetical protein A3I45_04810 [Candidatus Uhrbacteria bacterium RIFCSPLOWO2_02_FULL_53_10]